MSKSQEVLWEVVLTEHDLRRIHIALDFFITKKQILYTMQPGLHGEKFLADMRETLAKIENVIGDKSVKQSS